MLENRRPGLISRSSLDTFKAAKEVECASRECIAVDFGQLIWQAAAHEMVEVSTNLRNGTRNHLLKMAIKGRDFGCIIRPLRGTRRGRSREDVAASLFLNLGLDLDIDQKTHYLRAFGCAAGIGENHAVKVVVI